MGPKEAEEVEMVEKERGHKDRSEQGEHHS